MQGKVKTYARQNSEHQEIYSSGINTDGTQLIFIFLIYNTNVNIFCEYIP